MSYKDPIKNRAKVKEYRDRYPERVASAKKTYAEANKDEINSYHRAYAKKNAAKKLLIRAKYRAKAKGLDFDLEADDIEIPEVCPYLGFKLVAEAGRQKRRSISLDRIDSSKGYTKGNVRVISWLANTMKNNATLEELFAFAEGVFKLHSKEDK